MMSKIAGVVHAEIVFDNPGDCYFDMQVLSGTFVIDLDRPLNFAAILIELCGIAVVRKSQEGSDADVEPDVIKEGCTTEKYFHKKITLLEKDGGKGKKDAELEVGEHSFPFECKLPPELPSSFEGLYGQIRYLARAVIDRQSKSNIITKKAFTVLSGLDLNFIPEAAAKIEICKYKRLGGCCSAGSVTLDWTVARSGYVPGEDIWIRGAVQNDGREPVAYSKVTLFMIIEYKGKKTRKKERRRIAMADKGETLPDDVTVWHDSIHIPPVPPTGLTRSTLIDINYELEFKALIEGGHSPIVYTKDLYIGTVPMSRKEMKSCIAGLFNQPYVESTEELDRVVRSSRSQASLTHIIAAASASEPTANPTAPSLSNLHSPDLDDEAAAAEAEAASSELQALTRPPPYAPGFNTLGPIAAPPSAPSTHTLERPVIDPATEANDALYPDLNPTFETSSIFGPVNLRDSTDDGQSLRGECTYFPVYPYYGTLPYGAKPHSPL